MSHDFLEVAALSKHFDIGRGRVLKAVQDVSFRVPKGQVMGLVGESGSGKSTLVRIIARLIPQTEGDVLLERRNISRLVGPSFAREPQRRDIQMVFQDPLASLNPRFRARRAIADPVLRLGSPQEKAQVEQLVEQAATRTGLPLALLDRYPHELSGGQRARVDIARATVLNPKLLILDEPTSALDASLQAHVVRTLMALRAELDLTYLFVSHDLNLVRLLSDQIMVMHHGQMVEHGSAQQVFHAPRHDYTKTLLAALPKMPQMN
ncbi:oligopeptide ABC transporter ATPase [Bordetella ansorpii]|uniref:Oligopeptide ABC transporter ATPase n=1 Tax=Bordetella ansorpii TaxID=288768 RepID=A0A157NE89_9BORD|nr:ABC transporter ATP-binding protein [Bordetella ansorpii]SAI19354.1 oligopeptide ABC transporter ATPase [Bordetella ansorpii]